MNTKSAVGLTCAVLMTVTASAGTYYASPDGTGSGAQGDPCSLMDAVAKVNADKGGEIVLATGTYQEAEDVTGTRHYDGAWSGSHYTYSYYLLGKSGENYPITIRSATGNPEDVTLLGRREDNKSIRLFRVYGNAIRISGITMSNSQEGTAYHGGGAVFGSPDPSADPLGGPTVEHCIFQDNVSYAGGAIYGVNASDCKFFNNTSSEGGAAICKGSALDCTFVGNTAGGGNCSNGGAVYGGGIVSNCTFIANNTPSDRGSCACVYGNANNTVVDSRFLFNTNTGWCNFPAAVGNVSNILRCAFVGNCGGSGNNASASACFKDVTFVTDCGFTNNTAALGSAIGRGGRISGCDFFGHTGNQYAINAPVSISNCTFRQWYGKYALIGGNATGLEVYDSHFFGCTNYNTSGSYQGGCILGAKRVERCDFTSNYAQTYGGALNGVATVVDCCFTNNVAGGAYGSACYNCKTNIGCICSGERAGTGVIYQPDLVSNCTFVACVTAGRTGGSVYGKAGTCVYDSDFLFCTNKADYSAGAAIENVDLVYGCSVISNYSIYHAPVRTIKVAAVNCVIRDTVSTFAGAITGSGTAVMTNCLITSNHSRGNYTNTGVVSGFSELVNCTIVSNTLANKVAVSGGTVYNSLIIDNSPSDVKDATLVSSWWSLPNGYASVDANCRQAVYADVKFRGENEKGLPPFALKPKSPARGAGQTLPGQSDQLDLAGHPRVAEGQNVDLGAYAYFPAPFGLMLMLK